MTAAERTAPAASVPMPSARPLKVLQSERQPVLEVHGLCVDYGVGPGALHAVVNADLVVHRGGLLGLAGESGSGKSSLAYGITRMLRSPGVVTGGEARLTSYGPDGAEETVDLLEADESQLRGLRWSQFSVVPQASMSALNPVIRIGSQFSDIFAAHRPGMSRTDRRQRAEELMEMVGVGPDRLRDYPHQLSGGQRQRVTIAMALALEPQLVVMDEPTTALDVVTQREVLEELSELRRRLGFATLFITHDLSLLVEVADEIAIMYAGRVVERAPARALLNNPLHPYSDGLLSSFPPLTGPHRRMSGIPGAPPDLANIPAGCPFHARCPKAMDRCLVERPDLMPTGDPDHESACWLVESR